MYTHMFIDVTMRVKEETLNLRAVGTQEELEEKMGRNDVNTVHMQELLRPMPEKRLFSKMILGCFKCIVYSISSARGLTGNFQVIGGGVFDRTVGSTPFFFLSFISWT